MTKFQMTFSIIILIIKQIILIKTTYKSFESYKSFDYDVSKFFNVPKVLTLLNTPTIHKQLIQGDPTPTQFQQAIIDDFNIIYLNLITAFFNYSNSTLIQKYIYENEVCLQKYCSFNNKKFN